MDVALRALLIPLALAFFFASLRASWMAPPIPRRRAVLLVPIRAFLTLGWVLLVLGPTASWLTVTTFAELEHNAIANSLAFVMGCGTALFGFLLVLRAKRSFVLVNSNGIVLKPAFSSFRHIAWSRVQTVEYHSGRGQLTFRSERTSLDIGLMLRGVAVLLEQIRIALPAVLCAQPLARLEQDYLQNRWSRGAT